MLFVCAVGAVNATRIIYIHVSLLLILARLVGLLSHNFLLNKETPSSEIRGYQNCQADLFELAS